MIVKELDLSNVIATRPFCFKNFRIFETLLSSIYSEQILLYLMVSHSIKSLLYTAFLHFDFEAYREIWLVNLKHFYSAMSFHKENEDCYEMATF